MALEVVAQPEDDVMDVALSVVSRMVSTLEERETRPQNALKRELASKRTALLVHELIKAYDLLGCMELIPSQPATESQLRSFHSQDYLNSIKSLDARGDEADVTLAAEEFGFGYDCPPLPQLFDLVSAIAGSSLTAAQAIIDKRCQVAINWSGGWHHCHRDEASGYCYCNDIVLAILYLLANGFQRVLYVDLDLHHGDGVENAFAHSSKVMTVSFHKYEVGFFPGTGSLKDVGFGSKGRGYSVNVPLKDGIRDENYSCLVNSVLTKVKALFEPQVIVCQCGADSLVCDPMNSFNLTLKGPGCCVQTLLGWEMPLILLGGGGYNPLNSARLWTYLTSLAVNVSLAEDIPDHGYFLLYKPSYELHLEEGHRKDYNEENVLATVSGQVLSNLDILNKPK